MKIDEDIYQETSDFNICVVLIYFGHHLVKVDRSNPRRCLFSLSREEGADRVLEKFFDGELLVDPKQFVAIQKDLKSRIYA